MNTRHRHPRTCPAGAVRPRRRFPWALLVSLWLLLPWFTWTSSWSQQPAETGSAPGGDVTEKVKPDSAGRSSPAPEKAGGQGTATKKEGVPSQKTEPAPPVPGGGRQAKPPPADPDPRAKEAGDIPWRDEKQKKQCDQYADSLTRDLVQARHFSIQGDPCATAHYARSFLNTAEACRKDCPDGFITQRFTARTLRNLQWLYKSGMELCTGTPSSPTGM